MYETTTNWFLLQKNKIIHYHMDGCMEVLKLPRQYLGKLL